MRGDCGHRHDGDPVPAAGAGGQGACLQRPAGGAAWAVLPRRSAAQAGGRGRGSGGREVPDGVGERAGHGQRLAQGQPPLFNRVHVRQLPDALVGHVLEVDVQNHRGSVGVAESAVPVLDLNPEEVRDG